MNKHHKKLKMTNHKRKDTGDFFDLGDRNGTKSNYKLKILPITCNYMFISL